MGITLGVLSNVPSGLEPSVSEPRGSLGGARDLPGSMAALGDSITQAANVAYGMGDPARLHSWSTGQDANDPVVSHAERLTAARGGPPVVAYNDSVSGARMKDAPKQARAAVSQRVEYVTFLMGGNDACASSRRSMTSVRSFRRHFERAIHILVRGLRDPLIYVVSIPDVYRLWEVLNPNAAAREIWQAFGTCGALLNERSSERDRLSVRERVEEYNEVLAEVCAAHEACHYDGGAVFRYPFEPEDVSPLDFFHPSITGQQRLAEITWEHGPFVTLRRATTGDADARSAN